MVQASAVSCLSAQGGKKFTRRDPASGEEVSVDHVDEVKNENSYRVRVVPQSLITQLRAVIGEGGCGRPGSKAPLRKR